MPTLNRTYPTLIATVWPSRSEANALRLAALALIGTAILTLSAKVQVPFWPVPLTMQTFAVLAIGMAYGWRLGGATVVLYLLEGAFGLPVFAGTPEKGIGLAYLMGPTGGYLVGFAIAAAATGWLAERGWDRHPVSTALAMAAGNLLIYVTGVAWLSSLIGFAKAVEFGLVPFLLGDLVKLLLAAAAMPLAWWLLKRGGGAA
jgi:biotin transport system substrate-specific component